MPHAISTLLPFPFKAGALLFGTALNARPPAFPGIGPACFLNPIQAPIPPGLPRVLRASVVKSTFIRIV
ncbi:MAG: hypothetical protein KGJ88_00990 [Verrucomicrobiota bacterium]|nr:hypothetical protein [Verrucomicrobiota bacterium]